MGPRLVLGEGHAGLGKGKTGARGGRGQLGLGEGWNREMFWDGQRSLSLIEVPYLLNL